MNQAVRDLIARLPVADGMAFGPIFSVEEKPKEPLPTTAGVTMQPLLAENTQLYEILSTQFGAGLLRPPREFDDEAYYLPTREIVDTVILAAKEILPSDVRYWSGIFDCDDFAYCLKAGFSIHRFRSAKPGSDYAGMATGLIWGGEPGRGHVANVVVTVDEGVLIVDANRPGKPEPAEDWDYPPLHIII